MPLAKEFMDRVNRTAKLPNAGITIVEFFENVYIPAIRGKLARSTVKGYNDSWRCPHSGSGGGPCEGFQDGGWREPDKRGVDRNLSKTSFT